MPTYTQAQYKKAELTRLRKMNIQFAYQLKINQQIGVFQKKKKFRKKPAHLILIGSKYLKHSTKTLDDRFQIFC